MVLTSVRETRDVSGVRGAPAMIDLPSSPEKLTIAMSACLRSVIDELQSTREFHSVYGFGALMSFECISFDPLVFSEVNARKLTDDLRWEAVHHTDERWVQCDDVSAMLWENYLASFEGQPEETWDQIGGDLMTTAQGAAIQALRSLGASGALGQRRNDVVISIWEFDEDDEDRLGWASQLNPAEVLKRYAAELATKWSTSLTDRTILGINPSSDQLTICEFAIAESLSGVDPVIWANGRQQLCSKRYHSAGCDDEPASESYVLHFAFVHI